MGSEGKNGIFKSKTKSERVLSCDKFAEIKFLMIIIQIVLLVFCLTLSLTRYQHIDESYHIQYLGDIIGFCIILFYNIAIVFGIDRLLKTNVSRNKRVYKIAP